MIINYLKKIYCNINNYILFNPNKKKLTKVKQLEFLDSFPYANDFYEASYYKYKCVSYFYYSRIIKVIYNFASLICIPVLYAYFVFRGATKKDECVNRFDGAIVKGSKKIAIDDIIPEAISNKYGSIKVVYEDDYKRFQLCKNANKVWLKVVMYHPFSFHYLLILLLRLSQQSFLINKYKPKAIITYVCEREFSDPLLTHLSEEFQIPYEGFMHGDYLFTVYKAYMKYSCYYIWDNHYEKMFIRLKCVQKMEVYTPPKMQKLKLQDRDREDYKFFATYYFSGETKESVKCLKKIFDFFKEKGLLCKVRIHPRFSNLDFISSEFKGYLIEDSTILPLEESLESTYLVIALQSTVLLQALYCGKRIVIDDCTDIDGFNEMRDLDFIALEKEHLLLSEIISMVKEKNV